MIDLPLKLIELRQPYYEKLRLNPGVFIFYYLLCYFAEIIRTYTTTIFLYYSLQRILSFEGRLILLALVFKLKDIATIEFRPDFDFTYILSQSEDRIHSIKIRLCLIINLSSIIIGLLLNSLLSWNCFTFWRQPFKIISEHTKLRDVFYSSHFREFRHEEKLDKVCIPEIST